MEQHYLSRRVSMDTFNRNYYNSDIVMTPEEVQRSKKPYRYGMILLCFGALINWIGLAENYTDPFRYAGVACIIGGALLICTAMCCWLHVPNHVGATENEDDPIHIITVADPPLSEKPPEYDSVVLEPPCYDDAIKLSPSTLLQSKPYKDAALPNYSDLDVNSTVDNNNPYTAITIDQSASNAPLAPEPATTAASATLANDNGQNDATITKNANGDLDGASQSSNVRR